MLTSRANRLLSLSAQTPAPTAKTNPPHKSTETAPSPPPAAAQPKPEKPQMPGADQLTLLIQTHMVALSQAMLTGNYTVLHALGAPSFQQANSPQKLAETFSGFRTHNIDLTPIILYPPVLSGPPAMDDNGMVHVTGSYKTQPQQVDFDLMFQPVAGAWRLFSISAKTTPSPVPSTQPNPAPPAPAPTKGVDKK
jgi:hypothetical protein